MRLFRSLGTGGWKEAVLKIKMRKKLPAVTVVLTAVSIFCFLMLAQAFFFLTSGGFNALAAQRTASQAEQNARIEVKRLENLDYAELSYLAEHPRQVMDGVEDGNWESEVTLGPEKDLNGDDNVKIRLAHVSIFRTGDSVTRYDVDVPLTSATGTTPIGSVMTWTSEGKPTTGGVWLECNGQTIPSKYKRLRELIGSKTPDYRGMFLRGYGSQAATVPAGTLVGGRRQTFSSGSLGEVQGDAIRHIRGQWAGPLSFDYGWRAKNLSHYLFSSDTKAYNSAVFGDESFGDGYLNASDSTVQIGFDGDYYKKIWVLTRPPKRYELHGHGGDYASYSLSEQDDTDSGEYKQLWQPSDIALWPELKSPAAHENRPVNVAVRYFIKAR